MSEGEKYGPTMSRRHFLVAGASGLTLGVALQSVPGLRGIAHAASSANAPVTTATMNAYIQISSDNKVTVMYGGSELGQGTKTGLAQIVAEELKVPWTSLTVAQADADPTISYVTFGSSAVMSQFVPLATAGAAAREMLISAGATFMGVPRDSCVAKGGKVVSTVNGTTKTVTYGKVASQAATLPVPDNPPLTDPSQYKVIGQAIPRVDVPLKVDGAAIYGMDVRVPGMVFAAIRHGPAFGAKSSSQPAVPSGCSAVVPVKAIESRGAITNGDTIGFAVVASNTWAAMQGAKALRATWHLPANVTDMDSANIRTKADDLMTNGTPILAEPADGDVDSALAAAATKIDATYYLPYLAHSNLEVLNCTVAYDGTNCEIWVPTQDAKSVVNTAQQLTGLTTDAITVHTTLIGGGLGRKLEQDFVAEAIQVAMAINQPVMLVYSREEDFGYDQYRPMGLVNVKAAVNGSTVPAWKYRLVSPSPLDQHGFLSPGDPDSVQSEGAVGLLYSFGTRRVDWVQHPAGIPVGFWRSVGHSINCFAVESAIDELAFAAGVDAFDFRKSLLSGNTRATAVLNAADSLSGWRHSLPAGHGWGMAFSEGFGSIVCEVVEVSAVTSTSLYVNRVVCVIDCGLVVNPDAVQTQLQGGIVQGLGAALWGEVTFTNGKSDVRNFNRYRLVRVKDMPKVNIKLIQSGNPIGGVGETAVPPVAPAVANAVFRITNNRVRTLPFFPGQALPYL